MDTDQEQTVINQMDLRKNSEIVNKKPGVVGQQN
jgi:hypothetical protein